MPGYMLTTVICLKRFRLLILLSCVLLIGFGCGEGRVKHQEPGRVEVPVVIEEAKALQEQVDNGHRMGLRDPHQVAYEFLESRLKIPGSKVQEMKDIKNRKGFAALQVFLEDGRVIELQLIQPVRTGRYRDLARQKLSVPERLR